MSTRRRLSHHKWLQLAVIALLLAGGNALGATVCTNSEFPGSSHPDPRSYRDAAQAFINKKIAEGKQAEADGNYALAWRYYDEARLRFYHPDLGRWLNSRCATVSDYQRALQYQQAVGAKLARQAQAEGRLLWTQASREQLIAAMELPSLQYFMLNGGGALEFYLRSFHYDDFQKQLKPFLAGLSTDKQAAVKFSALFAIINTNEHALKQVVQEKEAQQILEGQREQSGKASKRVQDDTLGLLPDEAEGFEVLELAREQVVKQIERNIAYWLQQEEQDFTAVEQSDNMLSEAMAAQTALDKLKYAKQLPPVIKSAGSYKQEPWYGKSREYEQAVLSRAEQRGDSLMRIDKPQTAARYYSFAGARDKRDAADDLASKQGEEMERKMRQGIESGGAIFDAASEEERKQFDDEADALADELGL